MRACVCWGWRGSTGGCEPDGWRVGWKGSCRDQPGWSFGGSGGYGRRWDDALAKPYYGNNDSRHHQAKNEAGDGGHDLLIYSGK